MYDGAKVKLTPKYYEQYQQRNIKYQFTRLKAGNYLLLQAGIENVHLMYANCWNGL